MKESVRSSHRTGHLGFPKTITDPAWVMEQLMKEVHRADLLLLFARSRITPDLEEWFTFVLLEGRLHLTDCKCLICDEVITADQKTFGKRTQEALLAHGTKHIDELLSGKHHKETT